MPLKRTHGSNVFIIIKVICYTTHREKVVGKLSPPVGLHQRTCEDGGRGQQILHLLGVDKEQLDGRLQPPRSAVHRVKVILLLNYPSTNSHTYHRVVRNVSIKC